MGMPDEPEVEESYEANTVEELRDELRARDLHTSGNKEELIARLEEDDAAKETPGGKPPPDVPPEGEAPPEEAPDYYPPMVYSPYELPANTAAAQAFIDANPDAVDTTLVLDEDRMAIAQAAIYGHVSSMAEVGVTVEDPRLEGYEPPPEPEAPPATEPLELEEANA